MICKKRFKNLLNNRTNLSQNRTETNFVKIPFDPQFVRGLGGIFRKFGMKIVYCNIQQS